MKISTILLILCFGVLISACSQQTMPQTAQPVDLNSQVIPTPPTQTPAAQNFDIAITLSDNAKVVPPISQIPLNGETVFLVANNRTTMSVFEIPQLFVYAQINASQAQYISVVPKKTGYYQMKLNGAPYGTIQVK